MNHKLLWLKSNKKSSNNNDMKNLKVLFIVLCVACATAAWGAEECIYTCGFESSESFTAGTNYQNTVDQGPTGKQWKIYYGTTSTSSAITGNQSLAMRLYTSSNYGYARTMWKLSRVTKISFKAKAGTSNNAAIKIDVHYSIDGSSWTALKTSSTGTTDYTSQSVATTATLYTAFMPSTISGTTDVYLRISINSGSTKPNSSNAQLTIDEVSVYGKSGSTETTVYSRRGRLRTRTAL